MIRVYGTDGAVTEVDAPLIEIASADGRPAMFILRNDDAQGGLTILEPSDEKFQQICKSLGLRAGEIIKA